MSKELLERLEEYRRKNGNMTYAELARKLRVPEPYIYRWKKAGRIIGVYKRIVEDFLK